MSEDTKVLFPGQAITLSSGEEITIVPFTFVECMTSAAKHARSFAGSLTTGNVLDIIADGGEDVLKLVQVSVKKPKEWWDALPPDDGLALTAAVLTVNRDFFYKRLQAPLEALMKAIGEPSSPDSLEPATTGEPSSTTP